MVFWIGLAVLGFVVTVLIVESRPVRRGSSGRGHGGGFWAGGDGGGGGGGGCGDGGGWGGDGGGGGGTNLGARRGGC